MTISIKSVIIIGVAVFMSAGLVYGQENASPPDPLYREGGMGYFIGGVGMLSESGNNSVIYSAGGGGHSLKNRLILGGEGHSSFGPDNAGGYGFFDIGYALFAADRVILYPLLGLGGGAMTRDAEPTVSKCALLNPSICLDYLLYVKNESGVLLGLRAGYTFTVYSNTFNWSMPYIRLVVGGFGFED